MYIPALSLLQAFLGGMLVYLLLRLPKCPKFSHRLLAFCLAVIGNLALTTAIFYYSDFSLIRSLVAITVVGAIISLLQYNHWQISTICECMIYYVKKVIHGSSTENK